MLFQMDGDGILAGQDVFKLRDCARYDALSFDINRIGLLLQRKYVRETNGIKSAGFDAVR